MMLKRSFICLLFILFIDQTFAQEKYTVVLPEMFNAEQTYPLFIVFHGGNSNMYQIAKWWKSNKLAEDFIVVYMEASTLDNEPNRWGWRDLKVERDHVKLYYVDIIERYNIDGVYVGGFSLGARISIDLALSQTIPINGIISLNYGGQLSESLNGETLTRAKQNGFKTVLITGEKDDYYQPLTMRVKALFDEHNLSHKYEVNKGIGHEEPKNFSKLLDSYLTYLLN